MMSRRRADECQSVVQGVGPAPCAGVDARQDGGGPLRLLVLDPSPWILEQIQNALWMWPHKLATAHSVSDGVGKCRGLEPAAVFIANDLPDRSNGDALVRLRAQLPETPIIAITSIPGASNKAETLKRGANAVILRGELERPTLHNLLISLQDKFKFAESEAPVRQPCLGFPWQSSQMLACAICDINGTIFDANSSLVALLGYSQRSELLGRSIWLDVLQSTLDRNALKAVTGDLQALRHHTVAIRTVAGSLLTVRVEVFAVPESPSNLQLTFIAVGVVTPPEAAPQRA